MLGSLLSIGQETRGIIHLKTNKQLKGFSSLSHQDFLVQQTGIKTSVRYGCIYIQLANVGVYALKQQMLGKASWQILPN